MFKYCKNSKQQGDIGMGYAIAYYTSIGYAVSLPLTDSQEYDIVVEDHNKKFLKVQVKTSYHKDKRTGNYQVNLKTAGGNRSRDSYAYFDLDYIDLLFVLLDNGRCYSIPTSDIAARTALSMTEKYESYCVSEITMMGTEEIKNETV